MRLSRLHEPQRDGRQDRQDDGAEQTSHGRSLPSGRAAVTAGAGGQAGPEPGGGGRVSGGRSRWCRVRGGSACGRREPLPRAGLSLPLAGWAVLPWDEEASWTTSPTITCRRTGVSSRPGRGAGWVRIGIGPVGPGRAGDCARTPVRGSRVLGGSGQTRSQGDPAGGPRGCGCAFGHADHGRGPAGGVGQRRAGACPHQGPAHLLAVLLDPAQAAATSGRARALRATWR